MQQQHMFKILVGKTSIQNIIDKIHPSHFIFEKDSLYVIDSRSYEKLYNIISTTKIRNIYIEEITEDNYVAQSPVVKQEFENMQIQNDCARFEEEQQEVLRRIKNKLLNLQALMKGGQKKS